MSKNLVGIKYSESDILQIAKRIFEDYDIIFHNKEYPVVDIRSMARILEMYPQTEEDKIDALKLSAFIKYEIIQEIDYLSTSLRDNKEFNEYKSNSFAVNKALNSIYNYEDKYPKIPRRIEKNIQDAEDIMSFEKFTYKKLKLSKQ